MIAGASVRYRFYASWGLSAFEITQVVLFCTLTLWLGFFTLGGFAFFLDPLSLPSPFYWPPSSTRKVGALLLAVVIGYLITTRVRSQPIRFRGLQINLPSWKTGLLQMLVGAADWLLAGATHETIKGFISQTVSPHESAKNRGTRPRTTEIPQPGNGHPARGQAGRLSKTAGGRIASCHPLALSRVGPQKD